jgi:enamine deaminase RidA (YjgF/YER057c/UK114 family)
VSITQAAHNFNPDTMPKPLGMYSHVGSAAGGNVMFLAGQLSTDETGQLVGKGDFNKQVEIAFGNLGRLLSSIGVSFDDVISFNTYVVRPKDVQIFFNIRKRLFPTLFRRGQYPPNNLFVLKQLFHPDYLFEIVAVAARPSGNPHCKNNEE